MEVVLCHLDRVVNFDVTICNSLIIILTLYIFQYSWFRAGQLNNKEDNIEDMTQQQKVWLKFYKVLI